MAGEIAAAIISSLVTAVFVRLWLNGKHVTKEVCAMNHEPIEKLTKQVRALVEVLVLNANISDEEKKQILKADGNG